MPVVVVTVVVVVLLLGAALISFNSLVRRRNRTRESWSQIDVELKRRHDLIPNLVATVKGYADDPLQHHEGTMHRLFDTHPPIAERIAALEHMQLGLTV